MFFESCIQASLVARGGRKGRTRRFSKYPLFPDHFFFFYLLTGIFQAPWQSPEMENIYLIFWHVSCLYWGLPQKFLPGGKSGVCGSPPSPPWWDLEEFRDFHLIYGLPDPGGRMEFCGSLPPPSTGLISEICGKFEEICEKYEEICEKYEGICEKYKEICEKCEEICEKYERNMWEICEKYEEICEEYKEIWPLIYQSEVRVMKMVWEIPTNHMPL